MRTLIFLFIGLLVLSAVILSKRSSRIVDEPTESFTDNDTTLGARLTEAAHTFSTAAASLPAKRFALTDALADLAKRCTALANRAEEGTGFSRNARSAIIRLLLALHDVVERVVMLEKTGVSETGAPLIDSAVELINRATAQLHLIADRADEIALKHLETDLEILRERLDTKD